MYERVNPAHPDKLADRIAGALVDLAYKVERDPKIAVEVLIGHGMCHIISETSSKLDLTDIRKAVRRIAGIEIEVDYKEYAQDVHLSNNQQGAIRCGDNGIFKGVPITAEQDELVKIAYGLWERFPTDGKFILDGANLTVCQSNADEAVIERYLTQTNVLDIVVNPLGPWTVGTDVDTGATNRKLGSDMGDSVTGGGLHGKDLSKADVSVNIYAFLKAQREQRTVELSCAIGDEYIDGLPYSAIVEVARDFIRRQGGFEKFAEWGLLR